MSQIVIRCPGCRKEKGVPAEWVGKPVRCGNCGEEFAASPVVYPAATRGDGVPRLWEPGVVVLGRYEVIPLADRVPFAEGGFGRVNRVRDRESGLELAVKSVNPRMLTEPGAVEDFVREAEVWVTRLGRHPNTVAAQYVLVLGGLPRVFVEYVGGGSLHEWISSRRLYEGDEAAALRRVLDVLIQFAWGLHYCHEQGLVHRDVKPGNVMVTPDGVAKVTDFGLAGARTALAASPDDGAAGRTIVVPGIGGCTPEYASPEQRKNAPLSRRTDVYSWAVSALHGFLGRLPDAPPRGRWQGSSAGLVLAAFVRDGARAEGLPGMPPPVADLLRRCLDHDPDARPREMATVARELTSIYRAVGGESYPRAEPEPAEDLADSLNNRAVSLWNLGERFRPEAERFWAEALRIDRHHPESTFNWGLVQWRSATITDLTILQRLREVQHSCSDRMRVDHLIGLVHSEGTDAESAVRSFSQATSTPQAVRSANDLSRARALCTPPQSRTFEGHKDNVTGVSSSPDGRFALSTSKDGAARLWDVATGECLRTFGGHGYKVATAQFSPDGQRVLLGSWGGMLQLCAVSTGQCVRTFEGHTVCAGASFSPDGRHILSTSIDGTLRLWEATTGRYLYTLEKHEHRAPMGTFSPDGRHVLSGDANARLNLWEVATGQCLRTFKDEMHWGNVSAASFSPNAQYVLSADYRLIHVFLWDVHSGRCLRTFKGHTHGVFGVSFSPDGRFALSASADETASVGEVRVWEVPGGQCLCTLEGRQGGVTTASFSPDGRHILSASGDGTLRLWEASTGRCLRTFEGHGRAQRLREAATGEYLSNREGDAKRVYSVSFGPDGRYVLSAGADKVVRLWAIRLAKEPVSFVTCTTPPVNHAPYSRLLQQATDLLSRDPVAAAGVVKKAKQLPGCSRRDEARELERSLSRALAHRAFVGGWEKRAIVWTAEWGNLMSICPAGRFALQRGPDETLGLWELATGKRQTFNGHTGGTSSSSFSPNSRHVLTGHEDGALRLWESASGKCLRTFREHEETALAVSFSPDGRFSLSGSRNRALVLREVNRTGEWPRAFEGHIDIVLSVAFGPDGRFALSGSRDGTARLWEVSTGQCLRTFEGHQGGVSAVSLSRDGRHVLSGDEGGTLRLWDAPTGQRARTLREHEGAVLSVSFAPDSRHALSAGRDGVLRLWDTETGACLRTLAGHKGEGTSLASFTPDGRSALSVGADGVVRLWEFSSGKCVRAFEEQKGDASAVSCGLDGRHVLSGDEDGALHLWDATTGQRVRTFGSHKSSVAVLSFCPDGRYAISGCGDGQLRLWDVSAHQWVCGYVVHDYRVSLVSFCPDGRHALSVSGSGSRLWDVSTGRCLRTVEIDEELSTVSFGPDGRLALSIAPFGKLRLWEVTTGRCLKNLEEYEEETLHASISPDGRYALLGRRDHSLVLCELDTGRSVRILKGHTGPVLAVSFSPDGMYALSGSGDGTMRLWQVSTGQCLRAFEGHNGWVQRVSFSTDGQLAISTGADNTTRLWALDWEFEANRPADWDEAARPFLTAFLTLHTPYAQGLTRRGKANWTEDDFRGLLDRLGCAGLGWLRPDGVRRELEKMAAAWTGPPPLT